MKSILTLAAIAVCLVGCSGAPAEELDSVSSAVTPYALKDDYYVNCEFVGAEWNPFHIVGTELVAAPEHKDQWGARVLNGICQKGQFSTPVTLFGVTNYKFIFRYNADMTVCTQ
jgi:hypothetical protein